MTLTQTPPSTRSVDDARAAVIAARETLAGWESKGAQARAELAAREESAGEQILADPSAAEQIESRLTVLRSTVRAADRALAAQLPQVTLAESRYLTAEADALDEPLAAARAELDTHNAKVERLLSQLAKLEGAFIPEIDLINLRRSFDRDAVTQWQVPKSHMMRGEIRKLEDQVKILREMAAGRDPRDWERTRSANVDPVAYPACLVGPDALVKTHEFVASVAFHRRHLAELEALERQLPDEIAEWEVRGQQGDPTFPQAGLERRRARLETLGDEIAAARDHLTTLTGQTR